MRITNEPIARQVLGSKVKRRILAFLCSNQAPLSERELARVLGVSHVAVNRAMHQLEELNVVKGRHFGAATAWELNLRSFAYPYVKALVQISNLSPLDHVKRILKESFGFLNEIASAGKNTPAPVREAYIIGSTAEATASAKSDIDVVVIPNGKPESIAGVLRIIEARIAGETGNDVSFHTYSAEALKKNEPPWLRSAIAKGIRVV